MGVPINHPFVDGIFHYKPSIFGVPPCMETPINRGLGFVFENDTSKTRHLCYSTIHVWGVLL